MHNPIRITLVAIFSYLIGNAVMAQETPHHHHAGPTAGPRGHAHGSPGRHLAEETHALVKRLQAGGLVIFLRHERTELGKTRDSAGGHDDCASQRNLSAAGIESAKNTGQALQMLNIPVGEVRASPICRTMETARLAFGKVKPDEGLLAVPGQSHRPLAAIADDLKRLIQSLADARDKTNAVLVGHFHSPEALSGIFPEEGEAVVYERTSSGDLKVLGRLTAAVWTDVVHDLRRAGTLVETHK
jgi:broad specificity phosphatase PhoE